uniref:Ubiquitin carboxyl-terminal hydrolase n=1 Tax=Takifugu rubripes TaxID=31033 RepID=A0A674PPE0_TAKRU
MFFFSGPSCRHIKKGTDQALLKKLSGNSKWTSCQDCKDEENKENNCMEQDCEEEQETPAIWMCLKCGHSGCGRNSDNQHAIKHYETPHSDPHCLVISLDNWSVWCYICNDEVYYSGTGHLAQLVDNLKKQASLYTPNTARKGGSGISVKGLSNLGNTCFFNAVIQNLSQTQLLRQRINAVIKETSLNIEPVACPKLDPLEVQLDKPGPLTFAMCQLLNEIQDSKKSVATPQELFTQVCRKAARFKGFQQQDSQELLRYLLDGMRAEEIKRVNLGIEEALKESKKSNDEEQLKKTLKEYEKNGLPKNLVDYVFGGELTSTIMCQQCKTMFLDLSLPVSDEDDLVNKMEKVTVDDAIIEDHDALEWAQVVEDEPKEVKEYTVVNQDPKLAFHTFGTRTAPEKQECSVQSCLFQFTEVETLTEKNSLLCVTCTKQQPDKGKGSKNVYTDALKQMLISSLPPVLTLHLKRFQQNGYSICKVNRHVQFPLILDLAPFCGVKCKNVADGEPQILYSLYGIVVHSGTMRSGHYTAYVKVRPEGPKLASNGLTSYSHFLLADAESPRGKWFHISDTHVQPVSESNVQSCQAYLLFYERVV